MSGTLYVVATPIGNLEDLTPRARHVLASVDLIAAEDTRHTGRLLMTIAAKPALLALHDHNEERATQEVIAALQSGKDVALASDAGTPLVSDPGFRLLRAAHDADIKVVPIPGASAVTAALSVAGLPTDRFCFEGFAPSKRSARRQWLEELGSEARTIVMYESVHRIADCFADLVDVLGSERRAFVGRELTKLHEQCVCASLGELREMVDDGRIVTKGEFVLVIEGGEREAGAAVDSDRMLRLLSASLSAKEAARIASELTGERKNALYERVLEIRREEAL